MQKNVVFGDLQIYIINLHNYPDICRLIFPNIPCPGFYKETYIDFVFREILAVKRRWVCG